MIHKPSKVAGVKNSFSSVYVIDTTYFHKCFLFRVITERHYIFIKVCRYFEDFFDHHIVAFFETSALEKFCILSRKTVQC